MAISAHTQLSRYTLPSAGRTRRSPSPPPPQAAGASSRRASNGHNVSARCDFFFKKLPALLVGRKRKNRVITARCCHCTAAASVTSLCHQVIMSAMPVAFTAPCSFSLEVGHKVGQPVRVKLELHSINRHTGCSTCCILLVLGFHARLLASCLFASLLCILVFVVPPT